MHKSLKLGPESYKLLLFALLLALPFGFILSQSGREEYEPIDNSTCLECHEKGKYNTVITEDLSHSIHEGFECTDCHQDKDTMPHKEDTGFHVGYQGCTLCHETESEEYVAHGRSAYGDIEEMPACSDCHGDHDILPSTVKLSKTHPTNLPNTCGICHEDLNITKKYEIIFDHPVDVYESSVHGSATKEGIFEAAACNDCHSTAGTAHNILSPGNSDSSINHFNIPKTCGQCHGEIKQEFWDGIHGKLVARGYTESPVCTHCHGEHGILPPSDPRSPVSKSKVAERTCSPCHESIILAERYGLAAGETRSFIDSYHGLKSKAGDLHVANCASCHGVHLILPRSDSKSRIHPDNLQATCGECHPEITSEIASIPIHEMTQESVRSKAAVIIKYIYIAAIIIIIGLMALHWLIDLIRQIVLVTKKPQVRRMDVDELIQHTLLMLSFIVLVISGFALRYGETWWTKIFFGWEGGFELRGIIHRISAVILVIASVWHTLYLFTPRGKQFLKDMWPRFSDFKEFGQRINYNLGRSGEAPQFKRFSYIEKAEYWALIWGNAVMILTGILLWFDNFFVLLFPKVILEIALIIHFYEAILASLAILIWHMYSTVFNPHVYPMNPSWLTGKMPREMFKHEHPAVKIEESDKG